MSESKILNHPDREEIIQRLVSGESPNSIRTWLQKRYPEKSTNHISVATISLFRKSYLDIDRDSIRLLRHEKKKQAAGLPHNVNAGSFTGLINESEQQRSLRVKDALLQSPTYRDKLREITDAQLDAPKLMKELHMLLSSRIEVYYNEIATNAKNGLNVKEDKMFLEYVKLATDVLKDNKKVWDDYNKQPDEGTVDLDIVHEQVGIIRETVKDLLKEFDPSLALEFMDRLNARMSSLKYEAQKSPDILERMEKLNQRIRDIQEQGGKR